MYYCQNKISSRGPFDELRLKTLITENYHNECANNYFNHDDFNILVAKTFQH